MVSFLLDEMIFLQPAQSNTRTPHPASIYVQVQRQEFVDCLDTLNCNSQSTRAVSDVLVQAYQHFPSALVILCNLVAAKRHSD